MKKVSIPELGLEGQLVSSYADLKNKDLLKVVRLAYLQPQNWHAKIRILRQLFTAPPAVWFQLEKPENRDQLWRLLQTMDWILKGPDFRPAEGVKIRGQVYLLPDTNLHQLKTAEFVVATAHLIGFHSAKTDAAAIESLAKFMATIARPKPGIMRRLGTGHPEQDPRETYNSVTCDKRAKSFEKIDLVTMIMTAQWFNNAANKMLSVYGMSGGGDADAAPISQGIFVQDWERQIVRVAESHVYGGYDQVMGRLLADVLAYIELKNDEARRKAARNAN